MNLDVDVELALLSEKQWRSVRNMLSRRGKADVELRSRLRRPERQAQSESGAMMLPE